MPKCMRASKYPMLQLIDLSSGNAATVEQTAALLHTVFRPLAWETMDEAREEIAEMLSPDRILRVAIDDAESGAVIGMIGGISHYNGHVWELHALAVRADHRKRGLGRRLVEDLEEQVKARGGLTITLGTDDEDNRTSLSNNDLYENLWQKVTTIRNLNHHPYEFYQKLGYVITGIVPDANGWGKPDILMSKRLG